MTELAPHYKLMGIDVSPYSMKVLAYLKYKGVSWEWFPRNLRTEKIFRQHAQVPLIPMLFLPDGSSMQDSTPIIEYLEAKHPIPSIYPDNPALRFLAALLEEFGDEWCNKLMFFQRWFAKTDQIATGERIAGAMLEGQWFRPVAKPILARFIVRRMIPRLSFAGANKTNIPHLQRSFESVVAKLDSHLETRPYLLGGRPSFGDFGIWGNIYQAWTDPTAGSYMNKNAGYLVAWIERMLAPDDEGPFETLEALAPTLRPLLKTDVAERFLKWSVANDKAWKAEEKQTSLEMGGVPYEQKTFKYHSFSLGELRKLGLLESSHKAETLACQIHHGAQFESIQWALGRIDDTHSETRALYGLNLAFLGLVHEEHRREIQAKLKGLERKLRMSPPS